MTTTLPLLDPIDNAMRELRAAVAASDALRDPTLLDRLTADRRICDAARAMVAACPPVLINSLRAQYASSAEMVATLERDRQATEAAYKDLLDAVDAMDPVLMDSLAKTRQLQSVRSDQVHALAAARLSVMLPEYRRGGTRKPTA